MRTLPEKICRSQSTNQFAELNERLPALCFAIQVLIFSSKVSHPEPPHAQSLFLFPIVFGITLIQFFDGKNNIGLGRI